MHLNSSDQLLSPGKMFSNLVIVWKKMGKFKILGTCIT